jgi:hypothetical protein
MFTVLKTCAASSLVSDFLAMIRLMRGRLILWIKRVNIRGATNKTILHTLSFACKETAGSLYTVPSKCSLVHTLQWDLLNKEYLVPSFNL